jgi:hypothetical protein
MATPPDFTTGQVLTAAQMNGVGLWLVKTGTFTTQDLIADTAFSTEYDRYLLTTSFTYTNTAAEIRLQFRTSGSNNATSNYLHQNSAFTTVGIFDRNTVATTSSALAPNTGGNSWDLDLQILFPASNTVNTRVLVSGGIHAGSLPLIGNAGFTTTTAFDGIRIFPTAGTMTGTYKIYGYRN